MKNILIDRVLRSPVLHTLLFQGSAQFLLLLFSVLIARVVNLESYGDFVFGFQFGQFLATIAALGATFYLAKQFGNSKDHHTRNIETFSAHNYFLARGIAGLMLFWLVFHIYQDNIVASASFGISIANFVIVMLMAYFTAIGKAPIGNALQAGRSMVLFTALLISFSLVDETQLFSILLGVGWLYSLTLFFIFAKRLTFRVTTDLHSSHSGLALQHFYSVLLVGSDILILRATVESEQLAIYGVALLLSNIASFALYAVNANFTSRISTTIQSSSPIHTQKVLTESANTNILLSVPFLLTLSLFAYNLTIFYGDEFNASISIFFILLSGQFVNVLTGSVALVANFSGKEHYISKYLLQSLLFKVTAGLIASYFWGIPGMAIVAAVANAYWNARAFVYVTFKLNLNTTIFSKLNRV